MSESLTTSFEIASWDESPFDEGEGLGKLTRASVGRAYSGDIDGESVTEWAMAYRLDGSATFVGIDGSVATSPDVTDHWCSSMSASSATALPEQH
jgi:hypothetical protein